MPSYHVELQKVHTFITDVFAATAAEAESAARAMWNERQLRGIPDAIPTERATCTQNQIVVPTEETRRLTISDWLRKSAGEETTMVIPNLEVITKPNEDPPARHRRVRLGATLRTTLPVWRGFGVVPESD